MSLRCPCEKSKILPSSSWYFPSWDMQSKIEWIEIDGEEESLLSYIEVKLTLSGLVVCPFEKIIIQGNTEALNSFVSPKSTI